MSSSSHIKKKDILILVKGPVQAIEHILAEGKLYSINLTKENTKFWLSFHYNGAIVIYLLMVQKLLNSKRKTLKLQHVPCV